MKRVKFIAVTLAAIPLAAGVKAGPVVQAGAGKGFRVGSGEVRNGGHFRMQGVTMNELDLKISSADTGGKLSLFEQTGHTPNGGPPLHIHLYQDEFFYILEGEYLFQVGEEKYPMKQGDTIYLPRGVQHAFVQLSEHARVIVSYLPAGKMEEFFRATSGWDAPPTPAEVARVFADHDMKVTGPPL